MMKDDTRIFVKASPGCRIKDPYTMIVLKEEGEWKPGESYWWRKIQFGDCFLANPPVEEVKPAEERKPAEETKPVEDLSTKKKSNKKSSNEREE